MLLQLRVHWSNQACFQWNTLASTFWSFLGSYWWTRNLPTSPGFLLSTSNTDNYEPQPQPRYSGTFQIVEQPLLFQTQPGQVWSSLSACTDEEKDSGATLCRCRVHIQKPLHSMCPIQEETGSLWYGMHMLRTYVHGTRLACLMLLSISQSHWCKGSTLPSIILQMERKSMAGCSHTPFAWDSCLVSMSFRWLLRTPWVVSRLWFARLSITVLKKKM